MKRVWIFYLSLGVLLLGLPLLGVWLAGYAVIDYLEFPPRTQHVEHAPFSWSVFAGMAAWTVVMVLPFFIRIIRSRRACPKPETVRRFPWWGWLGVALGALFWVLAWTRFSWFEPLQRYTFTPQWLAYIVVINALVWRKTGRCLLTHETRYYLALFPLSAAFWWFFEYLNRFVQNWWYTVDFGPSGWEYFFFATLAFSTVLPAVLSTEEWLAANPRNTAGLDNLLPARFIESRKAAIVTLLVSTVGLLAIGPFPDQLYPLLWIAPLLILMAFHYLYDGTITFPEVSRGDWRRVYRFGIASLICGVFWELWNWHSLVKWIYEVPYVSRFHIFEMPLLGFAGYLPFGLECAVIGELIRKRAGNSDLLSAQSQLDV